MRLAPRTTLAMLLVAGTPLALLGVSAVRLSESALRERAGELHATVARAVSEKVDDALQNRVRAVQQAARTFEFSTLEGDALQGALRLVFRQVQDASIVALIGPDAAQVAPPVHLDRPSRDPVLAHRPAVDAEDVARFARHLPFQAAAEAGAAVGPPYVSAGGLPRVALAARTAGGEILAVELSLEALRTLLAGYPVGEEGRAFVVDAAGRLVLDADTDAVAAREDRSAWPAVAAALAGRPAPEAFHDPLLGRALGAVHVIPGFDWAVVVAEPEEAALAAARTVQARTVGAVGLALLAAGVLGVFITGRVVRPVRHLHEGALALSEGRLGHRVVGADRRDELGDVARAFNAMAADIERWNRELEQRVDAKTRELRDAQELLLRSQKMAAVGELGAGVAHEINNPLAGLLGVCQIALAEVGEDDPVARRLRTVESQALRIREIVENLRRLTLEEDDVDIRPTSVGEALEAALSLVETRLARQGIEVVRDWDGEVTDQVQGDPTQLTEAFLHLLSNARQAMPDGGRLTARIENPSGQLVAVRISDTGEGVPEQLRSRIFDPFFTDKKDWQARGMGLTLVHRIVEAHHGRITVDDADGGGATFSLLLPVLQRRALA